MSLDTLIADTRKAIADDAANAHAVFTAQGTLVGVSEVDIKTGAHSFTVDEPPALGGADAAANPVQYAEERYAELAAAVDAHCPVLDLFQNPVPVSRALITSGYLASGG